MTAREAGQAVAYLNAVFPREALEPETVAVWVDEISRLKNPAAALEAARQIGRGEKRFPSLTDYLDTYRRVARAMEPALPQIEAVTSGPRKVPDSVKEWLALRGANDWNSILRDM